MKQPPDFEIPNRLDLLDSPGPASKEAIRGSRELPPPVAPQPFSPIDNARTSWAGSGLNSFPKTSWPFLLMYIGRWLAGLFFDVEKKRVNWNEQGVLSFIGLKRQR